MSVQKEGREFYPIFTQLDIQFATRLKRVSLDVTYVKEDRYDPPPTLRIARAAVQWAIGRKIDTLYIACALPHLWRCKRDLKAAVKEANASITVSVLNDVHARNEDEWFRHNSWQPRTQSKEAWRSREMILRLIPFSIYKKIAS